MRVGAVGALRDWFWFPKFGFSSGYSGQMSAPPYSRLRFKGMLVLRGVRLNLLVQYMFLFWPNVKLLHITTTMFQRVRSEDQQGIISVVNKTKQI